MRLHQLCDYLDITATYRKINLFIMQILPGINNATDLILDLIN